MVNVKNTVTNTVEDVKDSYVELKIFLKRIYYWIKENKLLCVLIGLIILIVIATYYYSGKYRTESKANQILKNFVYKEPRKQIDFCGIENRAPDTIIAGIEVHSN